MQGLCEKMRCIYVEIVLGSPSRKAIDRRISLLLLGDHGGQLEIPREIDRHAGACPAGSQLGRSWPLQLYRPKNQRETSQTPATYTRYQDRNERVLGAANARMADTFCVPGD